MVPTFPVMISVRLHLISKPSATFMSLHLDGIFADTSYRGTKCYSVSADPNVLGDPVKCPADPAPSKNPDGSPAEQVADGLVQTWCDTSPGGLSLQFVNTVGCLTYGYHEANGDVIQEANDGGTAVCDSVFAGACTYFGKVSPVLEDAQNMPCVDEPGENYCDFAGPGK